MSVPGTVVSAPRQPAHPAPGSGGEVLRVHKILLGCGILAPLLYLAMNIFVPLRWAGYSIASQTISELSAIGAPTRPLWVVLGTLYGLLMAVFGWSVWTSVRGSRALRLVGALLLCQAVFGFFWPPMHQRGVPFSLTDALHILWAIVTLLQMLLVMGFAATALGRDFRLYTIATVAIWLVFGTLTGIDSPRIAANLPTPWLGVWERVNVGAYMLWVIVLAVVLLRGDPRRAIAVA